VSWATLDLGMASYPKLPTPATPLKTKHIFSETLETQQSSYKTRLVEVEKELCQELLGAVFVKTLCFLDTFFSVLSARVDRISEAAQAKGYHNGLRWTAFPEPSKQH